MKLRTLALLIGMSLSWNAQAVEVWHTPSGKSYEVYTAVKVGKAGKKSGFHIISYKTTKDLHDHYGLLMEYYDLLSQLYYFHLPANVRNDKNSIVTIEAFNKVPKSKKDKVPSKRFTKKLSDIKNIVKHHRRLDKNRLKAFQAFNKKKYPQAVTHFGKIKKKVPHDYSQMANAYLFQGKRPEAIKQLNAGIKKHPKNVTLLNNLAMSTMILGTFLLDKKYEYDPQKMKSAKATLEKAIRLEPKNWLTTSNMAVLETTLKNYKGAEKLYKMALKLSEGNPQLHFQMADFYHRQKNFKDAKRHYKTALGKVKASRSIAAVGQQGEITKTINERLKLVKEKKTP